MPKSSKPRKKHNANKVRVKYNPVEEHLHCPAEVRWLVGGPHAAELYCLAHQKHIQWLPRDMAVLFEQALKTAPGLSSN